MAGTIFERLLALFSAILTLLGSFSFNTSFERADDEIKFAINANAPGRELQNVVNNVNVWSIEGNPFKDAQVNTENNIFEFVEYIQLMQCSGGTAERDLFVDPLNKEVLDDYDFTRLLENCRGILNLGAKPMLKLGSVPLKYSSKATTEHGFGINPYPPDDYDVYYNYIYALATALVEEFGKEEVLSWRFGVMTEFENADWFIANDGKAKSAFEEYCKLYDYTVQALIDAISEDVYVGAHAMAVTEGQWDERDFIKHCAEGKNYKTGEKGSRLCYLSGSFYDSDPENYTSGYNLPDTIKHLRDAAIEYGLIDLEFGIDEGRILEGVHAGSDSAELLSRTVGYTYQASYDARLITQMFNNDIDYFSAWGYLSNGLLEGNPTVSYHVAKNAAGFAGTRLLPTAKQLAGNIEGADIGAVSSLDESTGTIRVMAYNFKNTLDYNQSIKTTFVINAPKYDGQTFNVRAYVIDDNCNYFDDWCEDRKTYNITDACFAWSPDDPQIDNPTTLKDENARSIYFNELYPKYKEASKLTPVDSTATVEYGKLTLDIELAPHAVVFFEITPQ
jgi:xylan 1,4-beta-xylosidase